MASSLDRLSIVPNSIAVIAVITICVVSIYLFCKNNSKEEDDIQAYLSEKLENDNKGKDVVAK